ncbi:MULTISPECIES: hypothetical protein [Cycloclasticus]|jgi:hypothetical protein|uniref:hypothetical protein n=1 Tax=Cycloclasticus TaxID=34067 RepID=UPI0005A4FCED|nr:MULTISPECIES: hypothetical protein [Cycloclasticus]MDF1829367.1 hypothetical protein [Cycloclasticus pugetii]SHI40272.1 hypothetical protein SAMN05519226_0172 [Cycloclasticus pugetii]
MKRLSICSELESFVVLREIEKENLDGIKQKLATLKSKIVQRSFSANELRGHTTAFIEDLQQPY